MRASIVEERFVETSTRRTWAICLGAGVLLLGCASDKPDPRAAGMSGTGALSGASGGGAGGMPEPMSGSSGTGATVSGGGAGGAGAGGEAIVIDDAPPCAPGAVYGDPLAHQPEAKNVIDGSFGFLEGPVWLAPEATLYYTNFEGSGSNGRIRRYRPQDGRQDVWLEGVGVNGLALDGAGMLVGAYHQEQRVVRFELATKMLVSVPGGDQYQSAPLNSVNDVVVREGGHIYFTDPNYQRGDRPGQSVAGSYHLTPAGILTLIDTQEAPNGIALSPDGSALYIAGTGTPHPLMKYAVAADGTVATPGVTISELPSDGMAVDCAGNLYLTTGGSSGGTIAVLAADGQPLGIIPIDALSGTTSAGFGGLGHKTLYVTTDSGGLFEVPMVVPGLP